MVKIYSFHFNNHVFLRYQHLTLKRFMQEPYEFICVNNSNNQEREAIENEAKALGIAHLTPQGVNHSQAGWSHQTAMQWTWDNYIKNDTCPVWLLDHDTFAVKDVVIPHEYDMVGVMQGRGEHIKYFHPGILFINNTIPDRETINFTGEKIDGYDCDSGGNTYHYLTAHPDLKIKGMSMVNICKEHNNIDILPPDARVGYDDGDTDYFQICDEGGMLHCRNGSNWANNPDHNRKIERLIQTLNYYTHK